MLNWLFLLLIGGAVITAAFVGTMKQVTDASIAAAKTSVELAIGLVGQMAVWLGFMGVLREAGLMRSISRGLHPVMRRLFPDVPADHPAMGAMIMNIAANMLGLGNAATPFGLKAMRELNRLNPRPGVATNAMALFLAINTSGVAVLPLGAVAIRATLGSKDAAGIVIPSILATLLNTVAAVAVAKFLEGRRAFAPERQEIEPHAAAITGEEAVTGMEEAEKEAADRPGATGWRLAVALGIPAVLLVALVLHVMRVPSEQNGTELARSVFSEWLLPILMVLILAFGFGRKVKVYEAFIKAAKEAVPIAVTIIPFLVAILVAISMFRESGAMGQLIRVLKPFTEAVGFPAEALPMALIRPLSGSGATAVMTETMKTYGPDSFVGYLVSVINGTSETTFYVLAVYFGCVQVKAARHTVAACLSADVVGIVAALWVSHLFFG